MSIKKKTPSYHADPHVTYLSQLLEDIKVGMIQVPKFQRPLVWQWEDRLELLRSIRDGIPMGAVMVWRSTGPRLECYQHLGQHVIDRSDLPPQYLLDGVQRLTTLLGALSSVSEIDEDADEFIEFDNQPPTENFLVHFDFETNDFIREQDIKPSRQNLTLPMNLLLNSVGMLKFQRKLTGPDDEIDEIIHTCDKLSAAFREYKLPVIPIVTGDVEMATRTFQRLNSRGQRMSEAHMIHALSWGSDFDLNAAIHDVKVAELTDFGWEDLDGDVLLKACKIALGFGVYSKSADDIGAAFKNRKVVVSEVGKACGKAVGFLVEKCGISRLDLLPYAFQLILLTEAFRIRPDLTTYQIERLISWFWTTTYGEYFAGMSGDRVEKARKDLLYGLDHDHWELTPFDPFEVRALNRKFDFRSVRAKAFAVRLLGIMNSVRSTEEEIALLGHYGRECVVQLLPRSNPKKSIYSSYASRFLINPKLATTFRDRLLCGQLTAEEMDGMLIDQAMLSALGNDDHEKFLELRGEKIASVEKTFYVPHLLAMGINI